MDSDLVRRQLRPLNLEAMNELQVEEARYADYYQIHFAEHLDRVTQTLGYIEHSVGKESYRIACNVFRNEGASRTCFIVHGFCDHSGLFRRLIDYLLHRGCHVVIFDLPGHGLSSGKPLSINSFGDYVLVLRRVLEYCDAQLPAPWFVVGQSMGGAIVMDYLLSEQLNEQTGPFEKVVLLAPLVRPARWRVVRALHALLRYLLPNVRRTFTDNSHDSDFLHLLRNDSLQARRIPLRWVTAMIRWVSRFHELAWSQVELLIVQGTDDDTVDWRYNLKVIGDKFPKARVMQVSDAKHHLAGESDDYFERVSQAMDLYFERRKTPR